VIHKRSPVNGSAKSNEELDMPSEKKPLLRVVDTHCHLEQTEFQHDLDTVIDRASKTGVHMITSAITPDTWSKCLDIAHKFRNVHASIGLDPVLFADFESALNYINKNASQLTAIGEVGLDHYRTRDHSEREYQKSAFEAAIEKADELRLPVQVHSRSAGKKAIEILSNMNARSVHMHAFDGKASLARVASREKEYYFSIPTSVVRSSQKRKLVKAVDVERILVETDSPVLGPDRESRNEPSNVWVALREVANILKREEEEMREILLENTLRLYPGIRTM
jgi:TatD DNase family protein